MRHRSFIISASLIAVLSLAFFSLSCRKKVAAPGGKLGKTASIRVVATVGMVGDLVRMVGGEHVAVEQICGAGVDPHLYNPTTDDVRSIMEADAVFYCGLHLEGKMDGALAKVKGAKPAVAIAETIPKDRLLADEESGEHGDPHVWNDVQLWSLCLDPIADTLSTLSPEHAEVFRENAADYKADLMKLHEYGKSTIATIPKESRVLITSHDAFNYFGRAYEIDVMGVQGLSTESEAGLQRINRLVDTLIERDIKAVFVESSVSAKNIEALLEGARSKGHEVKIGGTLFSDAMGTPDTYEGTYYGMLDHNITTTAKSLGGNVDAGGIQGKLSAVKSEEEGH